VQFHPFTLIGWYCKQGWTRCVIDNHKTGSVFNDIYW